MSDAGTWRPDLERRYHAAMHAVQSGVAAAMARDASSTRPKHLRVGINSALVSHTALCRLLVDKGILSWDEYQAELVAEAEREVERYEQRLGVHLA